jgi:hypothetical protein
MTDLFADAVGTVAITNGVLRVELVQLRPNNKGDKLIPTGINQNLCAHFRRPMDMIFQG